MFAAALTRSAREAAKKENNSDDGTEEGHTASLAGNRNAHSSNGLGNGRRLSTNDGDGNEIPHSVT